MTSKPLAIVAANEPWCEAILEDGTKVRARLIFTSVSLKPDQSIDVTWQVAVAPPEPKRPDAPSAAAPRPN